MGISLNPCLSDKRPQGMASALHNALKYDNTDST